MSVALISKIAIKAAGKIDPGEVEMPAGVEVAGFRPLAVTGALTGFARRELSPSPSACRPECTDRANRRPALASEYLPASRFLQALSETAAVSAFQSRSFRLE